MNIINNIAPLLQLIVVVMYIFNLVFLEKRQRDFIKQFGIELSNMRRNINEIAEHLQKVYKNQDVLDENINTLNTKINDGGMVFIKDEEV